MILYSILWCLRVSTHILSRLRILMPGNAHLSTLQTMMGSLSQHTPPAEDQKSVSETEVIDFKASPQDTKHAMNTPTKQQPRIAGAVSPAPCPRIAFRDFKAWLSYNPPVIPVGNVGHARFSVHVCRDMYIYR